jgi:hypothetical protein
MPKEPDEALPILAGQVGYPLFGKEGGIFSSVSCIQARHVHSPASFKSPQAPLCERGDRPAQASLEAQLPSCGPGSTHIPIDPRKMDTCHRHAGMTEGKDGSPLTPCGDDRAEKMDAR